jgi:hypothetical protein
MIIVTVTLLVKQNEKSIGLKCMQERGRLYASFLHFISSLPQEVRYVGLEIGHDVHCDPAFRHQASAADKTQFRTLKFYVQAAIRLIRRHLM